jgi:hypothetical protein
MGMSDDYETPSRRCDPGSRGPRPVRRPAAPRRPAAAGGTCLMAFVAPRQALLDSAWLILLGRVLLSWVDPAERPISRSVYDLTEPCRTHPAAPAQHGDARPLAAHPAARHRAAHARRHGLSVGSGHHRRPSLPRSGRDEIRGRHRDGELHIRVRPAPGRAATRRRPAPRPVLSLPLLSSWSPGAASRHAGPSRAGCLGLRERWPGLAVR